MKTLSQLICKNITKVFTLNNQLTTILSDINYQFFSDTNYAIMGSSGAGKSTFMHLLAGFDLPTTGTITCNNNNLANTSPEQRAQLLGFLTQTPVLIAECSVIENCCLPLIIAGASWQKAHKQAAALLEYIGLLYTADWQIGQLSGGQKQRIALIRTLLTKPKFLLADELTGNLDKVTSQELIAFLLQYCKEHTIGLIISTHDPEVAAQMDLALLLKDGKLMQQTQGAFHEQKYLTQKNM